MTTHTDDFHERLEGLARAATPGPYTLEGQCVKAADGTIIADCSMSVRGEWEDDAAYVLAAVNALPELIAENRAYREACADLVAAADSAPPVDLIHHIGRAVAKARAALTPIQQGGQSHG